MDKKMMECGLGVPKGGLIADGKIHRFIPIGRKDNSGWYIYSGTHGAFGDWSQEINERWGCDNRKTAGFKQVLLSEEMRINQEGYRAERQSAQGQVSKFLNDLWQRLSAPQSHPYLERKGVSAFGLKQASDSLYIPLRDVFGKVWNCQTIKPSGEKRFQKNGRKVGCFHLIGADSLISAPMLYVAEGYATGASIHMATNMPVIIAFDAGNLDSVIGVIREQHPSMAIVLAGDDDKWKPEAGNIGRAKAMAAVAKYRCQAVFPSFRDESTKPTDWNDLHVLEGLETVKEQLEVKVFAPPTSSESLSECVARLSALPPLEYDRIRKEEADGQKVRVGTLDQEVQKARKGQISEQDKGGMFPVVEPWPYPVDAGVLFNDILQSVQRFIVCSRETALATALWCAFTWLIEDVQIAPLAVITAPEKRCGKSQLLALIGMLSCRPLISSNISSAAVFRVIEAQNPTLLIDEADSFLKDNEELRGVINSGHTRQNAFVIRTVGEDFEPKQFSTWGAKALSGIGHLSDTLMDRAVVLELRRKLPSEKIEKLRHAEPDFFETLTKKLCRFAQDASASIRCARPVLPESLNDRAQDNWEPLLAIADYISGDWPDLARQAAIKISGAEEQSLSLSTELLADVREAFEVGHKDRLSTQDLLFSLTRDDSKPWATYNRGKPITPHQLAKRLGEYGIKSNTIRIGTATPKGYKQEDFEEIFTRYLDPPNEVPVLSATPPQFPKGPALSTNYNVADN